MSREYAVIDIDFQPFSLKRFQVRLCVCVRLCVEGYIMDCAAGYHSITQHGLLEMNRRKADSSYLLL